MLTVFLPFHFTLFNRPPRLRVSAAVLAVCLCWLEASAGAQVAGQPPATAQKKIVKESDLPRFTYLVHGTVANLVQSDPDTFSAFARKVRSDLQTIFDNYEIDDKATKRTLLDAKLSLEEMAGENEAALHTIETIRSLEEKPDARLTSDITDQAILEARLDSRADSGLAYEEAFTRRFSELVKGLPWDVVRESVTQLKSRAQMGTAGVGFFSGMVTSLFQPSVDKSGGLDNREAWTLLFFRRALLYYLPVNERSLAVLQSYTTAHAFPKPDIWKAREVALEPTRSLHPVIVGIWDTGVDISVFPGRLYTDPKPGWHDRHGLAFDDAGHHSNSLLLPLSESQRKAYPEFLPTLKGNLDLAASVDSSEAEAYRKKLAANTPDQAAAMATEFQLYSDFLHGTHVAGIAVRGNPAARLVVFRFNDSLPRLAFPPTPEWARLMADNFRQIGEYCRHHHVRVVNMSWEDEPSEFEEWLTRTGKGQDPVARKEQALQLFQIWKTGIGDAIKSAPDTLFICAAGNANADAGFTEAVPPSLHLKNLIAVGAVDQAGDETLFTNSGETVIIDAAGSDVESYVPGGSTLKLSGTSMAAPNVANLAAKLFAIDPSLTPERVIALIKEGATKSEDGRRYLIDEKQSLLLLQQRARSK